MFLVHLASLAAIAAATAGSTPVDAPITSVTVYSDRARIVRTARVTLAGKQRIELPLLLDSVDPSTVRLEAEGGDVQRVDIVHVDAEAVPVDEARVLLRQIGRLDDQLAQVARDQASHVALLEAVRRLSPSPPVHEPLKPAPRLNPGGWASVFAFVDGWSDRMQAKVRELGERQHELQRERETLFEKAKLLGGVRRRSGYRVMPTVAGNGAAQLRLSYVVAKARWYPVYDIQLLPGSAQVEVFFAGAVSQESGEDWLDATLTLSTAVPAMATTFPRLNSWRIGERERFIPTPVAAVEMVRPAPREVPPLSAEREADRLRELLVRAARRSARGFVELKSEEETKNGREDRDEFQDSDGERTETEIQTSEDEVSAYSKRPPVKSAAPPEPEEAMKREAKKESEPAAARNRPIVLEKDARKSDEGERRQRMQEQPTERLGLAPPPGWVAPSYDSTLPASAAGGYDLTYTSIHSETVRSGKGGRRVALFSKTWPVTVERKLFPALAPEAFLVAEIKNPSGQALPGGQANLFVGADPAGVARLSLVAPGEVFTLPLGLDRAIKPVRNVKLVTTEKGILSKDELSEYVVTTEIVNPYRVPIQLRILDQIPVTDDKNVEIKLTKVEPAYQELDKVKGQMEWRRALPAAGKLTINFVYTLRRPKGYRVHQ